MGSCDTDIKNAYCTSDMLCGCGITTQTTTSTTTTTTTAVTTMDEPATTTTYLGATTATTTTTATETCNSFAEWSNTLKSCSNVKPCVHLVKTKEYGTCRDYCASLSGHDHTCFYAAEESSNDCGVKDEVSCDTDIKNAYGTSDMLCGCGITSTTDVTTMDEPATKTAYLRATRKTNAPTTATTAAPTTAVALTIDAGKHAAAMSSLAILFGMCVGL